MPVDVTVELVKTDIHMHAYVFAHIFDVQMYTIHMYTIHLNTYMHIRKLTYICTFMYMCICV